MRLAISPASDPPRDGRDRIALLAALVIAAAVFIYKMRAFLGLNYSLDLFLHTQIARSWLEGRPFAENFTGYHLSQHTYFLLLPLGLLVKPFGAPGLLFVLSLAAGGSCHLAFRLLRLYGVSAGWAFPLAALLTLGPLAANNWQDTQHGFHIELLEPCLALLLLWSLARRRLGWSLASAVLLLSVKEEAPILVGAIGLMVLCEHWIAVRGWRRPWREAVHRPALAVIALATLALPLLLGVMALNPTDAFAFEGGGFRRLDVAYAAGVRSHPALALFIATHLGDWILSPPVIAWAIAAVLGSAGLVLLRPHYLPLGLLLTVVSWLMRDNLFWAPRFAPSLGFIWCAAILGAASFSLTIESWWRGGRRRLAMAVATLWCALAVPATAGLVRLLPDIVEVYMLTPAFHYTATERAAADRLFARYRNEGRAEEPVIAWIDLFRYGHDRNLYWFYCPVPGRPEPEWILWDDREPPVSKFGIDLARYRLLGREDRFSLYRRLPDSATMAP